MKRMFFRFQDRLLASKNAKGRVFQGPAFFGSVNLINCLRSGLPVLPQRELGSNTPPLPLNERRSV